MNSSLDRLATFFGVHMGRAVLAAMLGAAALGAADRCIADETATTPSTAEAKPQDATIVAVKHRLMQLEQEREELISKLGERHPQVQAKKQQVSEAQRVVEYLSGLNDQKPATAALTLQAATYHDFLTGANASEQNAAQLDDLKKRVQQVATELSKRERQLAQATQQLQVAQMGRQLSPIEGGELRVFNLAYANANDAADKILSLFGANSIRVSIDDRTNALLAYGRAADMEQIKGLLSQIDSPGEGADADTLAAGTMTNEPRSVLLRVFWLADGLPEGEGEEPGAYLPAPVLEALHRLGLNGPRLVAQTVNSLAGGKGSSVNFTTNVPALLFHYPAQLSCTGQMEPMTGGARLQMEINVAGHAACNLSGSLVTPLGHYMVLGTANSIAGGPQQTPGMEMGMAAMPGGYGGEFGGRVPGPEGAAMDPMGTAEGAAPADATQSPKYETSRFAFVVQVIDGESYGPEGEKKRTLR